MTAPLFLENKTFAELAVGEAASLARTLSPADLAVFTAAAGIDAAAGEPPGAGQWVAALFASLVTSRLPGPGTEILSQAVTFQRPVSVGDTLTVRATIRSKDRDGSSVRIDGACNNQQGEQVAAIEMLARAPAAKLRVAPAVAPGYAVQLHEPYNRLIARCREIEPVATAVAYPCDEASLTAVVDAAREKIIAPILVGPGDRIRAIAKQHGLDLGGMRVVDTDGTAAAAAQAVALVRAGEAELLMKGSLHTDELMAAVVRRETGLRTTRRVSHCFVMSVPTYARPLIVTDAAVNIAPTLDDKVDIAQNAIDLAMALGIKQPKVAILSAVETVTSKIPSTVDAAALCKMADRGQITGGLLDGPLALDNAISLEAARIKGIVSPVAGQADILLVPDLEAGNMLAKNLSFLSQADAAGVVLGALVPIILTSRADNVRTRMASCAIAALYADSRRRAAAGGDSRMAGEVLLVLNAGSSSLKFSVFDASPGRNADLLAKGQVEGIGSRPRLVASRNGADTSLDLPLVSGPEAGHEFALNHAVDWLRAQFQGATVTAVGHRVVHGGAEYAAPVRIDDEVLRRLEAFCVLAPLHQPNNLAAIKAVRRRLPALPQVACFDTAFHRRHPAVADRFALPEALYAEGVRRYGFHGLSYEYILHTLPGVAPALAKKRLVIAHLGSGASMCAVRDGQSIDSTMGFTALDGLPMGTRCGAIDPGVLLYLIKVKGMTPDAVERLLYQDLGLRGLSGVSNDVRDLLASDAPGARLALDCFVYRASRELGGLAAVLGGIDALIFTAGIGEKSAEIRKRICRAAAWLGLDLDERANDAGEPCITRSGAKVSAWVIPTNEERMIALHTMALMHQETAGAA